jgi:fimbrial isopeptide formation D2 family protein/LPXTG-motif cell wall-anchored protein
MKNMKKVLAVLLTLAMVLGMSMTTLAATVGTLPSAENKETVTITNVKADATVTAYQIIGADYGPQDLGFLGYEDITEDINLVAGDYLTVAERDAINSQKVTEIAAGISDGTINGLPTVKLDIIELTDEQIEAGETVTSFTAELNAGYWIVLVTDSVGVYNPMLVGVYYTVTGSGSDNTLVGGNVNATSTWSLVTEGAYAKSSAPVIHKNSDATSYYVGEDINYTISTIVPDYSDVYTAADITYQIVDTVKVEELEIDVDTISVTVSGVDVVLTEDDYEIQEATKSGYKVVFDGQWVTDNANAVITITYTAELVGEIGSDESNIIPYDNKVVLTYTNEPGIPEATAEASAIESVYTYKVESKILKTGQDEDAAKLPGATFTIYTDADCTEKYTVNTNYPDGIVESDENGYVNLYGLDLGTYYIKETSAPAGYTLNDDVFKIVVRNEEEKVYDKADVVESITITIDDEGTATIPNTKLMTLPSTGGIGTTIFTIAGCMIMIAAAAMFIVSRKKEAK